MLKGKGHKRKQLTFDPYANEPTDAEFYEEFSTYTKNSLWSYIIFILVCLPSFCMELQNVSTSFTRSIEITCVFPEFIRRNWSFMYIRNLTVPKYARPCVYNDFNYSMFYNMKPEAAVELAKTLPQPQIKECAIPIKPENYKVTLPNFWNSCLSLYFKEMAYIYKVLGMASGHVVFGIIGDLYGRKMGQYISYFIYIMAVIIFPLTNHYYVMMTTWFFNGFGQGGLLMLNYILFVELTEPNRRGICTLYVSSLGVAGKLMGAQLKRIMANNTIAWYLSTVPSISLIFYLWYIPESPRWLLSYGKRNKAWKLLLSLGSNMAKFEFMPEPKINKMKVLMENIWLLMSTKKYRITVGSLSAVNFIQMFVHDIKCSFIMLREVKGANHSYLINIAELSSFLNVLPPFIIFGRNLAATWMNFSMGVCLLASLIINRDVAYYIMNLLALMSVFSMEPILFLLAAEMLPTCCRATGVGVITGIGQLSMVILTYALDKWTDMIANLMFENALCCVFAVFGILLLTPLPRATLTTNLPDIKRYM